MELAVYTVCYLASYLLDRGGYHWPSGLCLMAAAVWLYISEYRRTGNLVHLRGIFSPVSYTHLDVYKRQE